MRTGLIGVGPWGRKLATGLELCKLKISDYSRSERGGDVPYFGKRWRDWRELISNVDMVICAASPFVTYEVMHECIELRKPALLTKPLYAQMLPDQTMSAPVVIDYYRLWSREYQTLKKLISKRRIGSIDVNFCTDGPVRNFPCLFDKGSDVFPLLYDLVGRYDYQFDVKDVDVATMSDKRRKIYSVNGFLGHVRVNVRFGNAQLNSFDKKHRLLVKFEGNDEDYGLYEESSDSVRAETITAGKMELFSGMSNMTLGIGSPLVNMIQNFIDNSGFGKTKKPVADFRTFILSTNSMKALMKIKAVEDDV